MSAELVEKHCWICDTVQQNINDETATEETSKAKWVVACKCVPPYKYTHLTCLNEFIDRKQRGNVWIKVKCPHCDFRYLLLYPRASLFLKLFDLVDEIVSLVTPFIAGFIFVASVNCCCAAYGVNTIVQVMGEVEAYEFLGNLESPKHMLALPLIPVVLVCFRYIKWEQSISRIILQHRILKTEAMRRYVEENRPLQLTEKRTPITRVLCGALALPTLSKFFGYCLFSSLESNLHRAVLGCLTFICLKGAVKIYYQQDLITRQLKREIQNYNHSSN